MFVHQERLEHLLRPEHYRDENHYQKELERLFLPSWHLVGCRADFPRDGDFRTLELCGVPVLLRNFSGEIHAFLNVCAHRHCRLTGAAAGNAPSLKCQYHGWEFDAHGRTGRIPDARCFRPWDRENARLRKFRVAACGDLLFVSLWDEPAGSEGLSLDDYLGKFRDEIASHFSGPWRHILSWSYEAPANWKTLVENTLESYHLPEVHANSFGNIYPSEAGQTHELHEAYTVLTFDLSEAPQVARPQARLVRYLGGEVTNRYVHRHLHPGLVVITSDVSAFAVQHLPKGPDRMEVRHTLYAFHGERRGPLVALTRRLLDWFTRRSYCRLQREDAAIAAEQQRGLDHSPFRGVIGTREERLYAFQQYVLRRTSDAEAGQPTNGRSRVRRDTSAS